MINVTATPEGLQVSGIIAYTELGPSKEGKIYQMGGQDRQGTPFRSATQVLRIKNMPVRLGETSQIADGKLQCTLTVRNFRVPETPEQEATRKAQATVTAARAAIRRAAELTGKTPEDLALELAEDEHFAENGEENSAGE